VRSGDTKSIAVKPSYGLTDDEVEQMIGDSFKFAAEDLKSRQVIEARTEADAILKATEKALAQGLNLLDDNELAAIRTSLAALESSKSTEDHKLIRARIQDVEKATHHFAEMLMDSALKQALENKKLSELA
jgi:molecular chaperone DnaK